MIIDWEPLKEATRDLRIAVDNEVSLSEIRKLLARVDSELRRLEFAASAIKQSLDEDPNAGIEYFNKFSERDRKLMLADFQGGAKDVKDLTEENRAFLNRYFKAVARLGLPSELLAYLPGVLAQSRRETKKGVWPRIDNLRGRLESERHAHLSAIYDPFETEGDTWWAGR